MVSKVDGSTKSSTSKSVVKSIKSAFSKASKSSKSKPVDVEAEDPVVAVVNNDEVSPKITYYLQVGDFFS
jgi:hypothetical protein